MYRAARVLARRPPRVFAVDRSREHVVEVSFLRGSAGLKMIDNHSSQADYDAHNLFATNNILFLAF